MWWLIAGGIALGAALWGPIVSHVEQAKYSVIAVDGNVEIRDYASMIVAETEVTGERKDAISDGFRLIADYIFGNNIAAAEVAMTAPVTQQASEKIAMTAPVIQQGDGKTWKVRFVMPASYSMENLPKPSNDAVKLRQVGEKRFAVIRFSGTGNSESLKKHASELEEYLRNKGLKTLSEPVYAFYNPPWTLPFLRRNEVMLEITK